MMSKIRRRNAAGLNEEFREPGCLDLRIEGKSADEPAAVLDPDPAQRYMSSDAMSFAFTANSDAAFMRMISSPGYTASSDVNKAGLSGSKNFISKSTASCGTGYVLGECFAGVAVGRPIGCRANFLNISAVDSRKPVPQQSFVRKSGGRISKSFSAPRLTVPEGAARLRQLSALMRSLREVQEGCSLPASMAAPSTPALHPERRRGRPAVEDILAGFAGLKLMPPVALLPRGPAATELKGDLVARLGGLSGRFELSNLSRPILSREPGGADGAGGWTALDRGVSPGRAVSVAAGALAGSIRSRRAGPATSAVQAEKTSAGAGRRQSRHAPRASAVRVTRPPPDDWLEEGDRALRPLIPTLAHVLMHAAARPAGADAKPAVAAAASVFWAPRRPKVALDCYCDRLARFSSCSGGAFLIAVRCPPPFPSPPNLPRPSLYFSCWGKGRASCGFVAVLWARPL